MVKIWKVKEKKSNSTTEKHGVSLRLNARGLTIEGLNHLFCSSPHLPDNLFW
ncbi:MAG: hypothetical protein ACUZ8I_06490 [Candidatus Scalindua sp.]